tara:strand:- start:7411 stop:8379 length:969 start_codon:yes stop_codon:yes gene_type:complete
VVQVEEVELIINMKLLDIILEQNGRPKAVVMAGGAGVGKSYVLNQLSLDSLKQYNADKYVEDPDSPMYNKLGPAAAQNDKDVNAAIDKKESFVWDTTASGIRFTNTLKKLIEQGYDTYMVMVYTHPMVSYIQNFSRKRNIPGSAVFSTWRNVYQKIEEFSKLLKGNLSIFVNDYSGKFKKEIEGFDVAATKGVDGIKEYLEKYNISKGVGGSSFFKPVEITPEEQKAFDQAVSGIDFDKNNRSEDKAAKKVFLKAFQANGVGPGADKLKLAIKKYRDGKDKRDATHEEVLNNIAAMLYSPQFQELLKHSSPEEIDREIQNFL